MVEPYRQTVRAGVAQKVFEFGRPDLCQILNEGPATVWLGPSPGLSPAIGEPLLPNASKQWPAGTPLFAFCNTASTLFFGVPGLGNDPNAIASAIIAEGLADDIATAITGSGLSSDIATDIVGSGLADNIATSIRLEGVPPIDSLTPVGVAVVGPGPSYSPDIDVSRYAMANLTITLAIPTTSSAIRRTLTIGLENSLGDSVRVSTISVAEENPVSLTVPLQGDTLTFFSPDLAAPETIYIDGVLSLKNTDPSFRSQYSLVPYTGFSTPTFDDGLGTFNDDRTLATGNEIACALTHAGGPASICIELLSTAPAAGAVVAGIALLDPVGTTTWVVRRRFSPSFTEPLAGVFYLPNEPLKYVMINTGTGANHRVITSISQSLPL